MDALKIIEKKEKRFQKKEYNRKGKKNFVIKKGKIPVMISAPHAVNHFREGKCKYAERYTGGIARYLKKELGCHIIYTTRYMQADVNFDDENECNYKTELLKYVEENHIKVLIDLHGAAATRESAVELGTGDENHISLQGYGFIALIFKLIFEKKLNDDNANIDVNKVFAATNPNTISRYISSKAHIPCMQLEINEKYRKMDHKEHFVQMLAGIKAFVEILKDIDWDAQSISVCRAKRRKVHFPQNEIEISKCAQENLKDNDVSWIQGPLGNVEFAKMKKQDNVGEDEIYLTNRLIDQLFGAQASKGNDFENQPVLIYQYESKNYGVGQPTAGINEIRVSTDLFTSLGEEKEKYDYLLYSADKGSRMYLKLVDYGSEKRQRVLMPRYYRVLTGIEKAKTEDAAENKKEQNVKILKVPKQKSQLTLKAMWKWIGEFVLSKFIGSVEFDLEVCFPRIADENNMTARLSADMMKLLGVSENDKIEIRFGEKKESVRVLEITNEDDKLGDKDMLVGIPAEARRELGAFPGDIVSVRRDKWYTFTRNINQQLFAIFGTVLTIVTLSEGMLMRTILCAISIPFVIYVTFAEERVKVKKCKK